LQDAKLREEKILTIMEDVRENIADVRQNIADVRQNIADVRQDIADVRQNTANSKELLLVRVILQLHTNSHRS
jgi:hypothetical protein